MASHRRKYFVYSVPLWCSLFIVLQSAPPALATPLSGGAYYALVIGNNNYRDKQRVWKSLKNPINDALAVADVLKRKYGFLDGNVRLLTDATRRDVLRALNEIRHAVKPNDSVLIYYAGHGLLDEDTGEAYWIPVDAQGSDETNYLSHDTIRRKLGVIADKARHVLLVSDSCFSGTLVRGTVRVPDKTTLGYYTKKAKQKSVQVVAAGGKEFVDDNYRMTGHSPFTYFFIKELKDNSNRYLAVSEFITNIEKNVANNVKQSPVLGRFYGAGDEGGEFIFTRITLSKVQIRQEINGLLASAEKDFKAKRFISPRGNNARQRWEEVLRLDRRNRTATDGLTRIAKHYVDLAKKNIRNERFKKAEHNLKVAEGVKRGYKPIESVRKHLEKARDAISVPISHW